MRHPAALLLLLIFAPLTWAADDVAVLKCAGQHGAKVVSLQGTLEYDPESKGRWIPIQLNQTLCEGSRIHVGMFSRASILLPNGFVARIDEDTVLTFNVLNPEKTTLMDLLKGFVHFISRTPKHLQINTPIANAGPEGTEFALSANDKSTSLWVYEGGVKFFNTAGSLHLSPGQGAQAYPGQAPQPRIDISPQDAVNWALYYPPLIPYPEPSQTIDNDIRTAIRDFRQGRVVAAITRLDALPLAKKTLFFYKVRGAMRLTVGRTGLARQDIQAILKQNANDAEALALQSVLALTQNRKEEAYVLANRAITANPASATAYSALSYAEQGRFELKNALKAADQAVKNAPHDALMWARKAELELALGLTSDSENSVAEAEKRDAELERTQTVIGFTHLQQMDAKEAKQAFDKALQLDSTSPLARLGLGLAKIRNGNMAEGRQDLEIAATLDPDNSLIRSYLGKAYYEENRNLLAEDQFKLAKEYDPKDPTPYFYDAINKQTTNRPVEALHDMQKAVDLNGNRAVYRSTLALDKDAAARTANLARIYSDLGFGRVALKEAWKSLNLDAINPTAHRFLSDAYIGQPQYRVARASELLQAQLLQPINITPVQPQLTAENIGILNSTGPGNLSVNEYDPLFNANGVHAVLNGAYGSNNTKTDNAIISGIYNNLSGSLGQFHYQTDGFRKNDAYKQDIYDAFTQYAITPDLNIQAEFKSEDIKAGDVAFRLNGFPLNNFTQTIEQDTARVGSHLKLNSNQHIIASYQYTTFKDITHFKSNNPDPNCIFSFCIDDLATNIISNQVELQHLFQSNNISITTGGGYINQTSQVYKIHGIEIPNSSIPPMSSFDPPQITHPKTDFVNGYFYFKDKLWHDLVPIVGLSFDSFENTFFDRQQLNPKLGLIWNPENNLTLRSAVFRTLKRPLVSNQTIEPSQVAGFNQFFDEFDGTSTWEYAFGLDYRFNKNWYFGGEVNWRDAIEPIFTDIDIPPKFQSRNASNYLAYLYWTPTDWFSIRAEYHFDKNSRQETAPRSVVNPKKLITHQVPVSVSFFHPSGVFAKFSETYVDQSIIDGSSNNGTDPDNESFWTFDAIAGFRFPKKIGVISFEVRNLFDNHFRFQSAFDVSGPQITPYVPERQVFVKLNLFY